MAIRTFVKVTALQDEQGKITPQYLTFKDQVYEIDKVLDVRHAPAINAGGVGMRYTIRIGPRKTYLFQDSAHRWFVEEKDPGGRIHTGT